MSDIRQARRALEVRVLTGPGAASSAERRAAFDGVEAGRPPVLAKVAKHPSRVTDDDFSAARAAGCSEDQLFELVVCAAVGAASRQYDAALLALDAASPGKESRAARDPR